MKGQKILSVLLILTILASFIPPTIVHAEDNGTTSLMIVGNSTNDITVKADDTFTVKLALNGLKANQKTISGEKQERCQ